MPIAVEKLLDHRREGANSQQLGTFVSQFVLPLCLIVFKELNSNSECSDTLVTYYIFSVFLIAGKSHFFLERKPCCRILDDISRTSRAIFQPLLCLRQPEFEAMIVWVFRFEGYG